MIVLPLGRPPEVKGTPLRWNPTKGKPTCLGEWVLQHTWLLGPYIAVIVTLILIVDSCQALRG